MEIGHPCFLARLTVGSMPRDRTRHAIEPLGTRVASIVRVAACATGAGA